MQLSITLEPGWCWTLRTLIWQRLSSWRCLKAFGIRNKFRCRHYCTGCCSCLEWWSHDWDFRHCFDGHQRDACPGQYLRLPAISKHLCLCDGTNLQAQRIFEVVDRKPKIDCNASAGLKLNAIKGKIDLQGARFSYPTRWPSCSRSEIRFIICPHPRPNVSILRSLGLNIQPGEKVTICHFFTFNSNITVQRTPFLFRMYDLWVRGSCSEILMFTTMKASHRDILVSNLSRLQSEMDIIWFDINIFRLHLSVSLGAESQQWSN